MKTPCVKVHIGFFHEDFLQSWGSPGNHLLWSRCSMSSRSVPEIIRKPLPEQSYSLQAKPICLYLRWPQRSFQNRKNVGLDSYGFGRVRRTGFSVHRERSAIRYAWQRPHRRVSRLGIQGSGFRLLITDMSAVQMEYFFRYRSPVAVRSKV